MILDLHLPSLREPRSLNRSAYQYARVDDDWSFSSGLDDGRDLSLRALYNATVRAFLTAKTDDAGAVRAVPVLNLDLRSPGAMFEGVGALSGGGGTSRYLYDYPEDAQEAILDALFSPRSGGALQMLKLEIGGDTWSTQATEPSHMHTRGDLNCSRGYEWKIAVAARRRNPSISLYGLSWGVPGWIGNGSFFSQVRCKPHHNAFWYTR